MIGVIGVSHKSAPVKIRERFSFNEEEIVNFINSLKQHRKYGMFVVLSTCNRTEVYFNLTKSCQTSSFNIVLRKFVEFWQVEDDIKKYFYAFYDAKAVKHLFRVTAGLEAMALGEDQIVGQVKNAYRISVNSEFTDAILNRLFHKAFEVSKRVRTETTINEGAVSISYAGVELANKLFKNLKNHNVLLIGAGETGELVMKNLQSKGCKSFVSNRTYSKAKELAEKYKGKAVNYKYLKDSLVACDIIITSTASKEPIIDSMLIKEVMEQKKNHSLFLIDLGVPRNIAEDVEKIKDVYLYNIDALEEVIADNHTKRKKEVEKASHIIDEITNEFFEWLNAINLTPTIEFLKDRFETINRNELKALKNKLSSDEFEHVSKYGDYITGKYVRLIIKNLKILSKNGRKPEYTNFVNQLFELKNKNEQKNN